MQKDNWRRESMISAGWAGVLVLLNWVFVAVGSVTISKLRYGGIVAAFLFYVCFSMVEARREDEYLVPLSWFVFIPGFVSAVNIPLSFIIADVFSVDATATVMLVLTHVLAYPLVLVVFGVLPVLRSRPTIW